MKLGRPDSLRSFTPPARGSARLALSVVAGALALNLPAGAPASAAPRWPRPAEVCQMIDTVLGSPLPRARQAIKDLVCVKKAYRSGRLAVRAILVPPGDQAEPVSALSARALCSRSYRGSDPAWGEHWLVGVHLFLNDGEDRVRYSVDLEKLGSSPGEGDGQTGAQCGAAADGYLVKVERTWTVE